MGIYSNLLAEYSSLDKIAAGIEPWHKVFYRKLMGHLFPADPRYDYPQEVYDTPRHNYDAAVRASGGTLTADTSHTDARRMYQEGRNIQEQRHSQINKIRRSAPQERAKAFASGLGSAMTHPVTTYTDFYNSTIAPAVNKGVTNANTAFWNSGVGKAVGKGLDYIYGKRPPEVK